MPDPDPRDPVPADPWALKRYTSFDVEMQPWSERWLRGEDVDAARAQAEQQHAQAMTALRIEHRALIATEAAAQCRIGELEADLAQRTQERDAYIAQVVELRPELESYRFGFRQMDAELIAIQAAHTALQGRLRESYNMLRAFHMDAAADQLAVLLTPPPAPSGETTEPSR